MYGKLIEILKRTNDENKLEDFYIKTKEIYDLFELNFHISKIEKHETSKVGAYVKLNDDCRHKAITNLYSVELEMLYPKVLANLVKTNLQSFNDMFLKVLKIYEMKPNEHIINYINIAYGCLSNVNSKIYSNNINDICSFSRDIFYKFCSGRNDCVVYVDTNIIFFNNLKSKSLFCKYIKDYYSFLNFIEVEYDFGYFINYKKYILHNIDEIKYRGIRKYKP